MPLRDSRPVMDAGTAEGINAQMKFCAANDVHVNHVAKVVDIGSDVVMPMRRRGAQRLRVRNSLHARKPRFQQFIRFCLDPTGDDVSAGPPFGGLYLKPPSCGGLCEGVMTIPSASPVVRPRL
jgi:hypothetical protein